jgi:hypothetical protein
MAGAEPVLVPSSYAKALVDNALAIGTESRQLFSNRSVDPFPLAPNLVASDPDS